MIGLPQKLRSKKRHAAAIDDKLELSEKTRDSKQSRKDKFLSEDSDDSLVDPKDKSRSSVDGNYYQLCWDMINSEDFSF